MATALPVSSLHKSWEVHAGRGFWTKRKKTATSMLTILALIAGIAVAFKLFDQTVPNNVVRDASNFDFAVEVFGAPAGGGADTWLPAGGDPGERPIFLPTAQGGSSQFPGDTRSESVRIRNTNANPAKDATFFVYVDPASIEVWACNFGVDPTCAAPVSLATSDPNYTKFLNFWTLSIDKEKVLTALGQDVNENDHGLTSPPPDLSDHDASGLNQETEVCAGGLRAISRLAPCNLGLARSAGSAELGQDGTLQPTDTRWYTFNMTETDDGTDQSIFRGWQVRFTMVFQARVPAIQPSAPISER